MDVFGKGTDEGSRPLLSPAICFICENSPTQEAERVIDTRREFNPNNISRLSGRKYICEGCVRECGQAMGFVSPEDYETIRRQLADTEERVALLEGDLALARNEQHQVVSFDLLRKELQELAVQYAPKPVAVKPAAKAPVAP